MSDHDFKAMIIPTILAFVWVAVNAFFSGDAMKEFLNFCAMLMIAIIAYLNGRDSQ